MKRCNTCNAVLTPDNWPEYSRKNYMYFCVDCANARLDHEKNLKRIKEGKIVWGKRSNIFFLSTDENGKEIIEIPLTKGEFAIIDKEDVDKIIPHQWYVQGRGGLKYACRYSQKNKIKTHLYMHREILGLNEGDYADHINGDGLDNRRCNLRKVTHRQNMQNIRSKTFSSKYPGVQKLKDGWWKSVITINRKITYLGTFKSEKEAYAKYKEAVKAIGEIPLEFEEA